MRGRVVEVTSVYVPSEARRFGLATKLMLEVIEEADKAGKVLLVQPKAFDRGGMDGERLAEWYWDLGFIAIQTSPLLMARKPEPWEPVKTPIATALETL
jgi:predicted GNAT family acetyltransferase